MELNKIPQPSIEEFRKQKEIFETECTPPYSVKVRLKSASNNGIFIDIPQIKKLASYLNQDWDNVHPPKDCDGAIVDADSKTIYLIELKRSKNAATPKSIEEQLDAGMHWLRHIAFCVNMDLEGYQIVKVVAIVNGNRSRTREYKIGDRGYYRVNGNSIMCDYFVFE
ncbi:hypothetical protein [Bacillus pacificus]|uniref:hypothetical protein n=1 Tax=Bacillus pacificus TaxID=2026187 RepID=UPI003D648D5D